MADKLLLLLALLVVFQTGCITGPGERPPLPPAPEIDSSNADGALKRSGIKDLAAFFADPAVQRILGTDWTHRKQALLDYGAFVHSGNETPLSSFTGGNDRASAAQFTGKAAMVFHLLGTMIKEDAFSRAVAELGEPRTSGQQSWDDIREVFEKESGQDLGWFFSQWVDRKGLPSLQAENPSVRRSGSRYEVNFDVIQKNGVYILDLPVNVSFRGGGNTTRKIRLDEEQKQVTLTFEDEPLSLAIDRDYDLPRMLTDDETPPLLSTLLGDEHPVVVLPVSQPDNYKDLRELFQKQGAEERKAEDVRDKDLRRSSFVLLGKDNPVIGRLLGKMDAGAGVTVQVKKSPLNHDNVVVLIQAQSSDSAAAAAQELTRYGASSTILFNRNITAQTAASERGILMELEQEPLVIDLSLLKTMNAVMDGAAGKKIVYVGEYHDRFAHHNVQLQVIKSLHKKDPKLAIGMEMFQRPFQKTLDDYLGGAIDEREFLKRSEYFKRWGFDYNLYKPILDFARTEKVPVVALNLTREIVEKVSKNGMDALSDEEKKALPQQMDFSDDDYRDRLKQVFSQHKSPDERSFDFFYQAQILWDETMAESIDRYLQQHPDHRMVVLAGGGHIAFESGIPKRSFRRNSYPYVTVLNDADIEPGAANYIVYPRPLEGTTAPRLMVSLKEQDSRLRIVDFQEGSVAKQAGLIKGDTIVSVDGSSISSVEDLKLMLFYKKKGDTLVVKVMRKRFLRGDTELEFTVTL
jgi:aminopeptidase N